MYLMQVQRNHYNQQQQIQQRETQLSEENILLKQ